MAQTNPSDVAAFLAVAEARSFRAAALLRGVSPSSLSEAVRRLEERMGTRLLNRTTRSVTPTEAGTRLLAQAGPALAAVDAAVADAAGTGARLRLNVPTVAAVLFLPDLIARFMAAHPEVQVEVVADNRFVDVLAAGFDAGIRYDESLDHDMIAVPIGPRQQRWVTAASPEYWRRAGMPQHPDELLSHRLIRYRFASGVMPAWEFRKAEIMRRISGEAALIGGVRELLVSAAEAGQGVVHLFDGFLDPALRSGRLQEALADWSERFTGPSLYFPSRRLMPQGLRRFVDFLKTDRDRAKETA